MPLREQRTESTAFLPKTMKFCRVCQKETPHEVRSGGGVVARMCLPCLEHELTYELDRD
jgi:hypothetical protein